MVLPELSRALHYQTLMENKQVANIQTSVASTADYEKKRAWGTLLLVGAFEIGYALSVGGSQAFTVLSWSVSASVFFF